MSKTSIEFFKSIYPALHEELIEQVIELFESDEINSVEVRSFLRIAAMIEWADSDESEESELSEDESISDVTDDESISDVTDDESISDVTDDESISDVTEMTESDTESD